MKGNLEIFIEKALKKKGDTTENLISLLETRPILLFIEVNLHQLSSQQDSSLIMDT